MIKRILTVILVLTLLFSLAAIVGCSDAGNNEKYLVLVNKKNTVGADFIPDDLVDIDKKYTTGGKSIQLEKTALEAVIKMLDAMKKDGIKNVTITSAYRTYAYQGNLFESYIVRETAAHPSWSEKKVREEVLKYSAAPGTSEHQTGLCVDLFTDEMEGLYNYGDETPNNPWDKGFAETLFYYIDQKGISDVECYKRANVDKKTFSKIKCNKDYRPSKITALSFAIALRLSLEETRHLLNTVGFSLSRSSKFDVIIEYFITTGNYRDIFDVNETLYQFDQSMLGT